MYGQEAGLFTEIYSQSVFSGSWAAKEHVRKEKNIPEDRAQSAGKQKTTKQLPESWLDLGILPTPGDGPFNKSQPWKQWVGLAYAHMHNLPIYVFHQQENKKAVTCHFQSLALYEFLKTCLLF